MALIKSRPLTFLLPWVVFLVLAQPKASLPKPEVSQVGRGVCLHRSAHGILGGPGLVLRPAAGGGYEDVGAYENV